MGTFTVRLTPSADTRASDSVFAGVDSLFVLNNVLFIRRGGTSIQVAWWDEKRLAWIGVGPCVGFTYTYITTEGE